MVRKTLFRSVALCLGVFLTPAMMHPEQHDISKLTYYDDPRYLRLKQYLEERGSPAAQWAADFIAAADRYGLDWRLLPAIAVIESGGGKRYINNNIFGWDSCRVRFPTVRDGIHQVAYRLATSRLYRDKDLDGILRTYNPYPFYPRRIKYVMRRLGPAAIGEHPVSN